MQLIAPERFLEHAVSENVYAGTAMARRAGYMYGSALDRGPWGQVGSGLGNATSTGVMGIEVPTHQVDKTGETVTVAGVEMEFQMTPNTEATPTCGPPTLMKPSTYSLIVQSSCFP